MESDSRAGVVQVSINVLMCLTLRRTTLRLLILAITRRPVLTQPTPQREYDIVSLPASLLSTKQTNKDNSSEALSPDFKAPSQALTPTIAPLAPLRSHLYPMVNALPETHLQDPLTLMPELSSPGAWASEVIEASVVLLHVVLLIRASVSRCSPESADIACRESQKL